MGKKTCRLFFSHARAFLSSFAGDISTYDAIVASHSLLGGVLGDERTLSGPQNSRAQTVHNSSHDEKRQEIFCVVIENVGRYEKEVTNSTEEHGNALTEQNSDGRRYEVGACECEVQRTQSVQSRFAPVIYRRLQVLYASFTPVSLRRNQKMAQFSNRMFLFSKLSPVRLPMRSKYVPVTAQTQ